MFKYTKKYFGNVHVEFMNIKFLLLLLLKN